MYLSVFVVGADDLEAMRDDDDAVREWLEGAEEDLDLLKAWGVLGHVLTDGDVAGLFAFARGPFHEEDLGYGPAIEVDQDGLSRMADALAKQTSEGLRSFLTSDAVRNGTEAPYPYFQGLAPDDVDSEMKLLIECLDRLREVVARARADDGRMVLLMT